jgi:hypothetical protein
VDNLSDDIIKNTGNDIVTVTLFFHNSHLLSELSIRFHAIKSCTAEGTPKDLMLKSEMLREIGFMKDLSIPLSSPDLRGARITMEIITLSTGDILVVEHPGWNTFLITEWNITFLHIVFTGLHGCGQAFHHGGHVVGFLTDVLINIFVTNFSKKRKKEKKERKGTKKILFFLLTTKFVTNIRTSY